jgi:hypothetical protein
MNIPIDNTSLRQLHDLKNNLTYKNNIEHIITDIYKNTKHHAITESTTNYNFILPKKNPISEFEKNVCGYGFKFNKDIMNILCDINNIPIIIEKLQILFPQCIIICKSYICNSGSSSIACKCKGHLNCINIDWSH